MSQDLASLFIKIDSSGVVTASRDLASFEGVAQKTEGTTKKVESATQSANSQFEKMSSIVKAVAASYAGLKLAQYIQDATMLAARYDVLGVVMRVVGNNSGYTYAEMEKFAKGLEKTGISMGEARQSLTRMTQAHLDLTKSSELARVAQDAAVIGNINSSESFQRIVVGIQSGQVEMLRTIGINVNFEQSYQKVAAATGRVVSSFTEAEKTQIRMNAVMDAGKTIAGTYEAAMGEVGKQVLSLPRYLENLKTMLGTAFTPALSEIIQSITGAITGLNGELSGESKAAIASWGKEFASNVATVISAIKMISAPVVATIEILWKLRDILIVVALALAVVQVTTFIAYLMSIPPAIAAIIAALEMAQVAVTGFFLTLGPVGLALAGLGVALTVTYSAYKLFGEGNEDAARKMEDFKQKAGAMDLTNIDSQLDWLALKLKNFAKDKEGYVGINIFGSVPKDEYSEDQLKNMIRYLVDQKQILITEQDLAKVRKEQLEINAKREAAKAKAAEAAKKAATEKISATKSITEAIRKAEADNDAIGQSAYEKEMIRIDSEEEKWRGLGVSETKINEWKNLEIGKADQKALEENVKNAKEYQKQMDEKEKSIVKGAKETATEVTKINADKLKAERDLYKDLRGYETESYEASKKLIDEQAKEYKKLKIDQEVIDAWQAEGYRKNEYKKAEYSDDFFEGVRAEGKKLQTEQKAWAKAGMDTVRSFAQNSQSTLSSIFFDGYKRQLKTAGDYFTSFADGMAKTFTNSLAEMSRQAALGTINMAFGATWTSGAEAVLGVVGKVLGYAADWLFDSSSIGDGLVSAPGYAKGGQHPGGWRIVGEEGPELEYTGASQIFNNSNTSQILQAIAGQGQHGDTMLAHINPAEASLLKALGGAGTINERTGLPQFWGFSDFVSVITGGVSNAVTSLVETATNSNTDDWLDVVTGGFHTAREDIKTKSTWETITNLLMGAKNNVLARTLDSFGTSLGTQNQRYLNAAGYMPDDVYEKNVNYTQELAHFIGSLFIGGAGNLVAGEATAASVAGTAAEESAAAITSDMLATSAYNTAIKQGASTAAANAAYESAFTVAMKEAGQQAITNIALKAITKFGTKWAIGQMLKSDVSAENGTLGVTYEGATGGDGLGASIKGLPSQMAGNFAFSAADGGVFSGPDSGYSGLLHGTEAVVPLTDGRSIPVNMKSDNNKELVAEIKGLRADLRAGNLAEVKNSGKIMKLLDQVISGSIDADGYPAMRVVTA